MTALMIFLGCLAAIVLVALAVNRMRGIRAVYLEAWAPDPGETVRFDDPGADFYAVPRLGQAKVMSFARLRRTRVLVTERRILIGTRPLGSRRHMLTHLVTLPGTTSEDLGHLTGGQFRTGYITYAAAPEGMTVVEDDKPYVRIVPDSTASSATIEHCRLYTDRAAEFMTAAAGSGSAA